jgi:hypothetical protein
MLRPLSRLQATTLLVGVTGVAVASLARRSSSSATVASMSAVPEAKVHPTHRVTMAYHSSPRAVLAVLGKPPCIVVTAMLYFCRRHY